MGAVACRCLKTSTLRQMLRATYYVPRQTAYPARFVAEVLTAYSPGHKVVEILVFSRSGPTAPWQVIEDSAYSGGPGHPTTMTAQDQDQVDSNGLVAPTSRAQVARTRAAAARLAAVWQEAKQTGRVPASASAFALGGQTGDRIKMVAWHRQDRVQNNGLLGHYRYYTTLIRPRRGRAVRPRLRPRLPAAPIHGHLPGGARSGRLPGPGPAQLGYPGSRPATTGRSRCARPGRPAS